MPVDGGGCAGAVLVGAGVVVAGATAGGCWEGTGGAPCANTESGVAHTAKAASRIVVSQLGTEEVMRFNMSAWKRSTRTALRLEPV